MGQQVSDRNTPAREGLPPCMSVARFGDRYATMRDRVLCGGKHRNARFWVMAGVVTPPHVPSQVHPDYPAPYHLTVRSVMRISTDDPAEAQAAFERGAEWVRTGEGP